MKRTDFNSFSKDERRRENGFSLLELMIALSILAVSVLALLSLTATAIQANLENDVRNASVRITNQTAEILLTQPITTLVTCGLHADSTITGYMASYTYSSSNSCLSGGGAQYNRYPNPLQTIRGIKTYPYNITWTVTPLTNDLSQAIIRIEYSYKGKALQKESILYIHKAL